MAGFLTKLRVEKLDNGQWRLLAPLHYESAVAGRIIQVPIGFETDFASVPRLPFMFWLLGDRGHAAAVVHDWLYRTELVSRSMADAVFREALESEVGFLSRWAMWAGVRIGGWAAYGDKHPDNA